MMITVVVGRRHRSYLSFTDDEEGVSSATLSDDVFSIFIMCLSRKKNKTVIQEQYDSFSDGDAQQRQKCTEVMLNRMQ